MLLYNVRKEMKCSGDSEILHELVRDNTQKSEKLKLIREVQYHELIRAVLPRIPASLHFLFNSVSIILRREKKGEELFFTGTSSTFILLYWRRKCFIF